MKTLDLYLNEQLKNEEFRKEWEENQPEMDIIRAMADARISQNLTQKELAERSGVSQTTISHFEQGVSRNLTLANFISLLRALGQAERLAEILPELPMPPMALREIEKLIPKRVRRGKK